MVKLHRYPSIINKMVKLYSYPSIINKMVKLYRYPSIINEMVKLYRYPSIINKMVKLYSYPSIINKMSCTHRIHQLSCLYSLCTPSKSDTSVPTQSTLSPNIAPNHRPHPPILPTYTDL